MPTGQESNLIETKEPQDYIPTFGTGISQPTAEAPSVSQSFIKEMRIWADEIIKATATLDKSREVALTYTQSQLVKSWLGKCLGETGSPNPYPESSDPFSKKIEAQADVSENIIDLTTFATHLEKVKFLRSQFAALADTLKKSHNVWSKTWLNTYLEKAILSAEEAKMWLGWELDRIRESETVKA